MIDHVTQDLDEYLREYEKGSDATEKAYQEFEQKFLMEILQLLQMTH